MAKAKIAKFKASKKSFKKASGVLMTSKLASEPASLSGTLSSGSTRKNVKSPKVKETALKSQLQALVLSQLMSQAAAEQEKKSHAVESKSVIYENLSIPSFEMLHLEQFHLEQKLNGHIVLEFSGLLPEEGKDQVIYYTQVGYQVQVKYKVGKKAKEEKMFQGIVTDVKVTNQGNLRYLYVTAHSNTIQLDALKNSCSFQEQGMTYKAMINKVLKRTTKASAVFDGKADKAIGDFTLQYRETDWEFAKRMAGRLNLPLIPEMTGDSPKFYFGCQFGSKAETVNIKEYSLSKNIKEYSIDSKNYISDIQEKDYISYDIVSYDIKKVGDAVKFKENEFYVIEAVYEMEEGIVFGKYKLARKNHFKRKKYHNLQISGISINGAVTEIQRDKLKVQLSIDNESNAKYVFPYSTMSASPDGSGWYCMPQNGDLVRVYFPDEEEKNCFAISSVSSYSPEGGGSDKMSDPNVRYLRTPDNKEITLTPDGIVINADDGKAVITLDKDGSITINGSKNITVTAENDITINAANNISMYASENISIKGSGGEITMEKSGDTKITGEYVLEN